MELVNNFTVKVPIEQAWALLTDIEKIAPCLPGASLLEIDGDEYRGSVKVKVGPITASYKGKARFIELDQANYTAVLKAEGRDSKGQGNASATVTAKLEEDEIGTNVTVSTDLSITGKVASFGRGVLADVSSKLLTQFSTSLEELITADGALATGESDSSVEGFPSSSPGSTNHKGETTRPTFVPSNAEPVNLLEVAGTPIVKRVIPAVAGSLFFLLWVFVWRSRKHRSA